MISTTGPGAGSSATLPEMRGGDGVIVVRLCRLDQVERLEGEGVWVVPNGEERLDVLVVGGGGGATEDHGGDPGETAYVPLDVRPGDHFRFKVGKGGLPGQDGGDSYFEEISW